MFMPDAAMCCRTGPVELCAPHHRALDRITLRTLRQGVSPNSFGHPTSHALSMCISVTGAVGQTCSTGQCPEWRPLHHHRRSRYSITIPQNAIRIHFMLGLKGSHSSTGTSRSFTRRFIDLLKVAAVNSHVDLYVPCRASSRSSGTMRQSFLSLSSRRARPTSMVGRRRLGCSTPVDRHVDLQVLDLMTLLPILNRFCFARRDLT